MRLCVQQACAICNKTDLEGPALSLDKFTHLWIMWKHCTVVVAMAVHYAHKVCECVWGPPMQWNMFGAHTRSGLVLYLIYKYAAVGRVYFRNHTEQLSACAYFMLAVYSIYYIRMKRTQHVRVAYNFHYPRNSADSTSAFISAHLRIFPLRVKFVLVGECRLFHCCFWDFACVCESFRASQESD